MSSSERQYDLVLLGATGYTGKFTAEYIHETAPTNLKWAIAGRNLQKLEHVAQELRKASGDRLQPQIEVAEQNIEDLDPLAKKTRVLLTTVGPYWRNGSPVVEACAKNGTHYVDVTGEIPWVRTMIEKWHHTAQKNGCIMIPQCGIDSVPADLLTYLLVHHIRKTIGEGVRECILSLQVVKGQISGGTATSALTIHKGFSKKYLRSSYAPYALSPVPEPKLAQRGKPLLQRLLGIRHVPELGIMGDSPQAPLDRAIVYRSWGLFDAGATYGPHFRFAEHTRMPSRLRGVLWHFAWLAFQIGLVIPPVRWLFARILPKAGEGVAPDESRGHRIFYKALAVSESGKKAVATLDLRGNGYYMTGVLAVEAVMEILYGSAGRAGRMRGMLTPATLEEGFVERLSKGRVPITVESL